MSKKAEEGEPREFNNQIKKGGLISRICWSDMNEKVEQDVGFAVFLGLRTYEIFFCEKPASRTIKKRSVLLLRGV